MSRLFNFDANDWVSLGDIVGARFERAKAWTLLTFFRTEDTDADDGGIFRKGINDDSTEQIRLRIDKGSAPQNFECLTDVGTPNNVLSGASDVVEENVWYLVTISSAGDGSGTLYVYDMSGAQLDIATADWSDGDTGLDGEIRIGLGDTDPFHGDIAHVAYVDKDMSVAEIVNYLHNPARTIAQLSASDGVQFYLPLTGASPEPDWSGQGNAGTVEGSPGVGDNPPTAPFYGFDAGWSWAAAGGEPPAGRPPILVDADPLSGGLVGGGPAR